MNNGFIAKKFFPGGDMSDNTEVFKDFCRPAITVRLSVNVGCSTSIYHVRTHAHRHALNFFVAGLCRGGSRLLVYVLRRNSGRLVRLFICSGSTSGQQQQVKIYKLPEDK